MSGNEIPDDGNFADNVFLYVFPKINLRCNVLFITQDGGREVAQKFFVDGSNQNPQSDKMPKKFPQVVEVPKNISPDERFKFADKVVDVEGNFPVTKKIDCDGVSFPRVLLHNQCNEFVGCVKKIASKSK